VVVKRADLAKVNDLEAVRSRVLVTIAQVDAGAFCVLAGNNQKVDDKALLEVIGDDVKDCLRRHLEDLDKALARLGMEP
jgi:hypothetical protein